MFLLGLQDTNALKIGPTLLTLKAKPGETLTRAVKLTNTDTVPLVLIPKTYEAVAGNTEDGFAQLSPKDDNSTLANWITVIPGDQRVELNQGESRDLTFSIVVPENAPAGGHYAVLSWEVENVKTPEESGAAVQGGIATNIALDVAGTVVEKGDVVSFLTEGDVKKYDKLPVTFITRINNGGNRHFRPQGGVVIKDMFGKEVALLPLLGEKTPGNVLPKATREFKTTWDSGFAFGKYTAVLVVMLGGAGKKTATYEFWVMPAGLAILWVIILVVVLLILGLLIKNMMLAMKKK